MVAPEDISVLKELAIIYDLMGKENLSGPLYSEIVDKSPDLKPKRVKSSYKRVTVVDFPLVPVTPTRINFSEGFSK